MASMGILRMRSAFHPRSFLTNHRPRHGVQDSRWKMAEKVEPLTEDSSEAVEEDQGQARDLMKTEDLLAMVKKLQKEGSLEPQIEDLICRINKLQQAKKKCSEELGEAQALWEALHRELDLLTEEKMHLEEVLNKKQGALRILQEHCQDRETEAQRLDVEEQLEDLPGQHKDLWEFHMLERRLARDISALERSREQLLAEGTQVCSRLQEVERRLRAELQDGGAAGGLEAELRKFRGHARSPPEAGVRAEAGDAHGDPEPQRRPPP